jgi:hypothetical protein
MSDNTQSPGRRPAYDPREVPATRFGWAKLREAGNSPIVKLTIAIPLVGYLIIFNEDLLHYLDLSRELFGHHDPAGSQEVAQVSWRLLFLYFGLCLVAVGAGLYGWFCPDEIKSYRLASDYVAAVLNNVGTIGMGRIEAALESGNELATRGLSDWREVSSTRPMTETVEEMETRWRDRNRGVLELHFDYLNRSHPCARLVCASCYAIGFIALFIPSADVLARVVGLIAKRLL